MANKFIPALIGVVVIAATGSLVYMQSQDREEVSVQETEPNTAQTTYTSADVAQHASESDCWSSINGGVYNLTEWIARHPGGKQAILGLCGKDGSAAFNGQHAGGASQEAILVDMKVGILAQ